MAAPAAYAQKLSSIQLEENDFLGLLEKCVGNAKNLQNYAPHSIPQEDLVADMVIDYLKPYSGENGPLKVRKVTYVKGRSNVIITYPGKTDAVVSFVGSHMDVVPANPEEWERDPFKLHRDGDKLFGRGVTDCLGNVCVLTNFFKQLSVQKPELKHSVVGVFIANEEASSTLGVGIDELEKQGELKMLKNGPLIWVDSADFGPTLGTAGVVAWQLTISGKKFHSGVPHKGINSIELAYQAVNHLQEKFYKDFTVHEQKEKQYLFQSCSSLKPTQISTPPGSLNQIPGSCTVSGDIRFTPFYSGKEVMQKFEQYVHELDVAKLPSHGQSKFHLTDENLKGTVELKWLGEPYEGVAVNLDSNGYKALHNATEVVCGQAKPFSLTGSLPIIRDLQNAGYDVQITGFGKMAAYHANNEFGLLSDFARGIKVIAQTVSNLEK